MKLLSIAALLSAATATTPAIRRQVAANEDTDNPVSDCQRWCSNRKHRGTPWPKKCQWKSCAGCDPCQQRKPEPVKEWKFTVFADVHSMTELSYVSAQEAADSVVFANNGPILRHIYNTYGGEVAIMPGDAVSFGGQMTSNILSKFNRPDLSDQDVIFEATKQCYRNTRQLFHDNGYGTLLSTVGDHELGGNEGFFVAKRKSKVETIPAYRSGFSEGFNHKYQNLNAEATDSSVEGSSYWYPETVFDAAIPSRPTGTPYEGTSFAYVHKNSVFVTVDAFEKVGDYNFMNRSEGTGGEGSIACTVTGKHLEWFEKILSGARDDASIRHIFVQAHIPIQQPVRKVHCSGQFLDGATESNFWKVMETYNVDIYFAGEVHSNTASQSDTSNLIQIVSRSKRLSGFLSVMVSDDNIVVTLYNEVGEQPARNGQYVESGHLTINKSRSSLQVSSSGELKLIDTSEPILAFDFEESFPLVDRQILGLRGDDSLVAPNIDIHGFTSNTSFHNNAQFGASYDAPMVNIDLEDTDFGGLAGKFDGSTSQMAIYAWGPFSAGEPISFSLWFRTSQANLEMVLLNYGSSWDGSKIYNNKDHFMLTLEKGIPVIRIQTRKKSKSLNGQNLADDRWHHIIVSMPYKSCLLSEVQIYVDKSLHETKLEGADVNIFTTTAGRLSIGGVGFYERAYSYSYPDIYPYDGLLDNFQLWARPINLQDIVDEELVR